MTHIERALKLFAALIHLHRVDPMNFDAFAAEYDAIKRLMSEIPAEILDAIEKLAEVA